MRWIGIKTGRVDIIVINKRVMRVGIIKAKNIKNNIT